MSKEVLVVWWDELKGIGSGQTTTGKNVFLNSNKIESNGRFVNLKENELVMCDIKRNPDGTHYASKIKRTGIINN